VASALFFNSVCLAAYTADVRALSLMHALFLRARKVRKVADVTHAQSFLVSAGHGESDTCT